MTTNGPLASWSDVNWIQVEQTVEEMRSQIFLAKKHGNTKRLRWLQGRMLSSKRNLLSAIRRVTAANRGRNTPGVDKLVYLTPEARFKLYSSLSQTKINRWRPSPVRRLSIPKANEKRRPLGIPTISDRVMQHVFKNALEPEWEAVFEHGSYGFRPGRSTQDAMIRTFGTLNKKKRTWVLEGDIEGCFDHIDHRALLARLGDFPHTQVIHRWLKAGVMTGRGLEPVTEGTPQGGILSPLLANIALHGWEKALGVRYTRKQVSPRCDHVLIRYADDFVVLNRNREDALKAKRKLATELRKVGLRFSEKKTRITEARSGFDFLGFEFKLFRDKRKRSGEVTLVRPSKSSQTKLWTKLRTLWRNAIGRPLEHSLRTLNQQIIGVANYYRHVNASRYFSRLDYLNHLQQRRYVRRSHPKKNWTWRIATYFKIVGKRRWIFYDRNSGVELLKFRSWKITRYIPVQYGATPDDPAWQDYFKQRRRGRLKVRYESRPSMLRMMASQAHICPYCTEELLGRTSEDADDEPFHVHHLIPKQYGGADRYDNLVVTHDPCHRLAHQKRTTKEMLLNNLTHKINELIRLNKLSQSEIRAIDGRYKGNLHPHPID